MFYLHLVSLESDLFVSEAIHTHTRGTSPQHTTRARSPPRTSSPPTPATRDLQRSRLGLWRVVLIWFGTIFYKYLRMYPTDVFFRMANRFGRMADGRYGEDTYPEISGKDSADRFPPWTGEENQGDGEEIVASLSFPSSDSFPMLHVPSAGPSARYTARSGPLVPSSSHTGTSISNTHVYVGQVTTAGGNNNAGWALNPFRHYPVHSTSWQAGCAVCDRTLSFPPNSTADVPNSLAASVRSIKRESTEPTRSAGLGLVGQGVA